MRIQIESYCNAPTTKKLLLEDKRLKLIGTQLQYHPTRNNILLSGSTDGLVNIYDTTVTDEDDALVQVINHGSVHHAGFLSESTIFALSHDEQFSIHPATNPDDPGQEPEPVDFDDLREPLGVEYVVQVCMGGQGPYIAAGNKMYVLRYSLVRHCSGHSFPLLVTVISGLIWFRWSLVPAGSLTRIIFGAFPVRMVMRLCAQYTWMNRYVFPVVFSRKSTIQ